jgi:hypothetical protein
VRALHLVIAGLAIALIGGWLDIFIHRARCTQRLHG